MLLLPFSHEKSFGNALGFDEDRHSNVVVLFSFMTILPDMLCAFLLKVTLGLTVEESNICFCRKKIINLAHNVGLLPVTSDKIHTLYIQPPRPPYSHSLCSCIIINSFTHQLLPVIHL